MNSLLAILIKSTIEYTYGLIERFNKDEGRMPTKAELLQRVDVNIEAVMAVTNSSLRA
jgi:hypothetical protein